MKVILPQDAVSLNTLILQNALKSTVKINFLPYTGEAVVRKIDITSWPMPSVYLHVGGHEGRYLFFLLFRLYHVTRGRSCCMCHAKERSQLAGR